MAGMVRSLLKGESDDDRVTVVCMGDSITYGHGLPDSDTQSYPSQLQRLLGTRRYRVVNCGLSGACATSSGDLPYWSTSNHAAGVEAEPGVVVMLLGTNDCKPHNWYKGTFAEDLRNGLSQLRALTCRPTVLLCRPPPLFLDGEYAEIHDAMLKAVDEVSVLVLADRTVAAVVDVHSGLQDETLFPDFVHPGVEGARKIAQTVYAAIQTLNLSPA